MLLYWAEGHSFVALTAGKGLVSPFYTWRIQGSQRLGNLSGNIWKWCLDLGLWNSKPYPLILGPPGRQPADPLQDTRGDVLTGQAPLLLSVSLCLLSANVFLHPKWLPTEDT